MGKFTAYKIPLKSLPTGIHEFDFHLDKVFFTDMDNSDIHNADLTVHLTVEVKPQVYMLRFVITGTLTLICDRCLDDMIVPVETEYNLNVKYGDQYDDSTDDVLVIPHSDNYLNVAYLIYDTAALAIPMRHVHPAGKCNRQMSDLLRQHRAEAAADGDDSSDGDDDNIATDPRWDALSQLTDNNE